MRVVGSAALGGARVPGVDVTASAVDLSVAVGTRMWTLVQAVAHALVRIVSAALRMRRPAVVAQLTAVRGRAVSTAGAPAVGTRIPAPRSPAEPSPASAIDPHRRELALPADPTAPRRARALLQDAAAEWGIDDDLHQDAAMVATELVANAVDHARTTSTFTVGLDGTGLHVAVRDGRADRTPRPRPVDPTAPRGRGLQMVDALTESWGVTVHADGKTVWAVLQP